MARWAKGKTGTGLDEHRATHTYMRLDGHRSRQSLIGLSVHCANSYIPHVQHIIRIYVRTYVHYTRKHNILSPKNAGLIVCACSVHLKERNVHIRT